MITKNTNNQNISAEFIENLRNGFPLTPKLLVDGVELECVIDELAVEKGSVSSDTFELGAVVGDIFTAKLRDVDIELKGKQLEYQLGVLVDDEYEFISLGKFKVTEAKRSRQVVNVIAYSSIISKTGKTFQTDTLTDYSISEIRAAIQTQTGVRVICDDSINTTVIIEKFPIQPTVYQVLQLLALVCGGFIINDNEGNILIKQFSHEPNLAVDGTLMTSLPDIDERSFLINSIGCEIIESDESEEEKRVEYIAFLKDYLTDETGEIITDEQNIEIEVLTKIDIDNAIFKISSDYMTKELFAKNWTNILGYNYYPGTVPLAIGDPRLEAWDVLSVTDVDGSIYKVPCHRINHTYRGSFTSNITAVNATLEDMSIGTSLPLSSRIEKLEKTSATISAIEYATELIRGGLGGYVVMTPGENGYPQEILIMDTPDIATAQHVWRFNQGGLGHSSNGYDGPFDDIALTQDGKINASMITTGILNANFIRAGKIQDEEGKNYWDLQTSEFAAERGLIGDFDINEWGLEAETANRRILLSAEYGVYYKSKGWFESTGIEIDTNKIIFYYQENGDDHIGTFDPQRVGTLEQDEDSLVFYMDDGSGSLSSEFTISRSNVTAINNASVNRDFTVRGSKSREVKTDNYFERLLYCYETPTPLFGDIGEAVLDEEGFCYVDIDDIFSETVADTVEYHVFLQKEGEGDCWITEKHPNYFVIQGTPRLKVAWELKAKQRDYENIRLEQSNNGLEEYAHEKTNTNIESYIKEQEELLYG